MSLITEQQLLDASGYEHRGHLAQSLKRQGVRFFHGDRGRIWTTLDELNKALHPEIYDPPDTIEFE